MDWHSLSAAEALKQMGVNRKEGLSNGEAAKRLKQYGENKLAEKKKKGLLAKFLEQFSDFMVIILLIASAVSFVTSIVQGDSDYVDAIIILVIVIINAITGVVQESKAEKAIDALKKLSAPEARILRNGKEMHVPSEQVAVGDILLLDTGDFVAADARLIEAHNLKAEESALTGESVPVEKDDSLACAPNAPLGDRKSGV